MMSVFSESIENKFNDLLEKAYDAEKGFIKAAENVDSTPLKSFFRNKANERKEFRGELTHELLAKGMKVKEDDGSLSGSLHRAWMDTKAFFSADNEEAMLEEVRNGEKAALEDYDDLLEDHHLPPSTMAILRKQRNTIKNSYQKADYLEDLL